tara:strand:+ start:1493 stop:2476 length:984 start_codon:yes stop_codon:yes gene_type:complete
MSLTGDPKKAYRAKGEVTVSQDLENNPEAVNMVPSNSGLYHTNVPMRDLKFKIGKGESVINHKGCYITMGGDRPGSIFSGLGARGFDGTDTIDIVVGRGASARGGRGPIAGGILSNMFSADASRIYVSQLTKIDKNFGIAQGKHQKPKARAGIGIKSDDVRIIGRNSIKIVTGRGDGFRGHGSRGETNSMGGKSSVGPTIELIAGNYDSKKIVYGGLFNTPERIPYLQSAIKGENLVACLDELTVIIGNIWAVVFNQSLIESGYKVVNSIDGWRPWVVTAGPTVAMLKNSYELMALWSARSKMMAWENYYLKDNGYRSIRSSNIYLT